jgi:hypothetical protein
VNDGWSTTAPSTSSATWAARRLIGPKDAQAAFAQYSRNVRCTSGFNLAKPIPYDERGGPPTLGLGRDCDFQPVYPGVSATAASTPRIRTNDPWGQLYSGAVAADPNARLTSPRCAMPGRVRLPRAGAIRGRPHEQDLNLNGVRDGWEYDRGINQFGQLGPPDGAVTAVDAQAAFAQFAHGASCTSGYNMQNK